MSVETYLLTTKKLDTGPHVRRLSSRADVKHVVEKRHGASNWIAYSGCVEWLRNAPGRTKQDSLLLLDVPPPTQAAVLQARFAKVWAPDVGFSFLPTAQLLEVVGSADRDGLFIAGVVDQTERVALLLRGNLQFVEAPFDMFRPSGRATPDFSKFALDDYGTAVSFGRYTATADSILYELDPNYRKRTKQRRLELDKSFGGSLRRLRMLKGLSQADFEPEISAKQVARIESGRTATPRQTTVRALAKRLRVKPSEIVTF
jgi:hypothetical protein